MLFDAFQCSLRHFPATSVSTAISTNLGSPTVTWLNQEALRRLARSPRCLTAAGRKASIVPGPPRDLTNQVKGRLGALKAKLPSATRLFGDPMMAALSSPQAVPIEYVSSKAPLIS